MTAPKASGHTDTGRSGELNWLLDDLVDRVASIRKALVLSGDGLPTGVSKDLTREDSEHLAAVASGFHSLAKGVGRHFEAVVIEPQLRSVIRDVTAEYEAKFLYSASRELVAQNMLKHIDRLVSPRGIEAEQVLLRAVQLPQLLTTAIQEKLQAEQQAQRMRFVLDRERQEAERKRVEGQGIADFQSIVARGISPELLKWKAIEVAHELSKSPNSKLVILGDKSGLPIILTDK